MQNKYEKTAHNYETPRLGRDADVFLPCIQSEHVGGGSASQVDSLISSCL